MYQNPYRLPEKNDVIHRVVPRADTHSKIDQSKSATVAVRSRGRIIKFNICVMWSIIQGNQ